MFSWGFWPLTQALFLKHFDVGAAQKPTPIESSGLKNAVRLPRLNCRFFWERAQGNHDLPILHVNVRHSP